MMSYHHATFESDSDAPLNKKPKKMKWDRFCWKCHKESENEIKCSNCVLTFHEWCIPDVNRGKSGWVCPECVSLEKPDDLNSYDNLNDLLNVLISRINQIHGVLILPDNVAKNPLLINPLTFDMSGICQKNICQKVKQFQYQSIAEILLDFKWLLHNCKISVTNCEKDEKTILNDVQKEVGRILDFCESEIKEITLCADCYLNREKPEGFTRLCTKPHLILWVKFKQFPYWPAKLIKIKNGRSPLEVCFFGDHTSASVSCQYVLLYTDTNPNEGHVSNQLEAAIDEAAEYIKNIEKKYGDFHFAKLYMKPMLENLDAVYLDEMIPGYRNPGRIVQLNGHGDSTKNQTTPENFRNASIQIQNDNRESFRFPAEIQAKLRECLECFSAQKAEIAHQKAEIARLNNSNRELIKALNRKNSEQNFENAKLLANAKLHSWCHRCLTKMSLNELCCQNCE